MEKEINALGCSRTTVHCDHHQSCKKAGLQAKMMTHHSRGLCVLPGGNVADSPRVNPCKGRAPWTRHQSEQIRVFLTPKRHFLSLPFRLPCRKCCWGQRARGGAWCLWGWQHFCSATSVWPHSSSSLCFEISPLPAGQTGLGLPGLCCPHHTSLVPKSRCFDAGAPKLHGGTLCPAKQEAKWGQAPRFLPCCWRRSRVLAPDHRDLWGFGHCRSLLPQMRRGQYHLLEKYTFIYHLCFAQERISHDKGASRSHAIDGGQHAPTCTMQEVAGPGLHGRPCCVERAGRGLEVLLSSQAPLPSTAVLFRSCQQSMWPLQQPHHHGAVMVSLQGWDPPHGTAASGMFLARQSG